MSEELVKYASRDGITRITLNDPGSLNSLSPPLVQRFGHILNDLKASDEKTRCLIITGEGRAFSSGGNLKQMNDPAIREQITTTLLQQIYHPLFRQLRDFPAPVVTSINGVAAGAGMSLALPGGLPISSKHFVMLAWFRIVGPAGCCHV